MTEHLTVEVNGNCRSCARLLDEVGHRMQEVAKLKVLCAEMVEVLRLHGYAEDAESSIDEERLRSRLVAALEKK